MYCLDSRQFDYKYSGKRCEWNVIEYRTLYHFICLFFCSHLCINLENLINFISNPIYRRQCILAVKHYTLCSLFDNFQGRLLTMEKFTSNIGIQVAFYDSSQVCQPIYQSINHSSIHSFIFSFIHSFIHQFIYGSLDLRSRLGLPSLKYLYQEMSWMVKPPVSKIVRNCSIDIISYFYLSVIKKPPNEIQRPKTFQDA